MPFGTIGPGPELERIPTAERENSLADPPDRLCDGVAGNWTRVVRPFGPPGAALQMPAETGPKPASNGIDDPFGDPAPAPKVVGAIAAGTGRNLISEFTLRDRNHLENCFDANAELPHKAPS